MVPNDKNYILEKEENYVHAHAQIDEVVFSQTIENTVFNLKK